MPEGVCSKLAVSLVLVYLVALSRALPSNSGQHLQPVCEPGVKYWSPERRTCLPCKKCAPEFTLSPCAVHKDAICGPLSALELDWSFLTTSSASNRKRASSAQRRSGGTESSLRPVWSVPDVEPSNEELDDAVIGLSDEEQAQPEEDLEFTSFVDDERSQSNERRKSRIEDDIRWDWQTGALTLAVCACIVFFLVAGCSALIYARQWRRMKRNFEPAGLEEISARLNLMVKAELAELAAGAPMNPGDPETRCLYLEKLLDRKRETPVVAWPEVGNLYIEESGRTPKSKRAQIARIHRNIEAILSHKENN